MTIVVAIPAFNEERTIAAVVLGSQKHADTVIVCDDGSNDLTAEIAEKLGARVIRHERNAGKGEALRSLFRASNELNADFMITIDGDGQHNPAEIPLVLAPLQSGEADIVVGSRMMEGAKEMPDYRKLGNRMLNAVTYSGVTDTQSGFRGYNREALKKIIPIEMGMGVDSQLLMDADRAKLRITEVPVSVRYGTGKTSTHNPFYHTLDVVFSVLKLTSIRHPLIFYGVPGLGLIVAGLYFAAHSLALFGESQVINNVVMTYELLGFALTIFGLLTFFTGVILFTLTTVVRKGSTGSG
jgi:glycosyltransferase involved in cell wall biosynthesis